MCIQTPQYTLHVYNTHIYSIVRGEAEYCWMGSLAVNKAPAGTCPAGQGMARLSVHC